MFEELRLVARKATAELALHPARSRHCPASRAGFGPARAATNCPPRGPGACHSTQPGGDPAARFHFDNGARLERLNPLGDLSAKARSQSFGLMVNYLYDLQKIETHHEKFLQGSVAHSRALASLL